MLIFPGRGGGIGERVALRFPWKDSSKFELGPKEFFKTKLLLPSTKMGLEMGPVNLRVIKCCQVDLYMNQTSYPPKSQHILWNITPKHNPPKNPPKKIQIAFKSHPTHLPPQKQNTDFFLRREFLLRPKSHPTCHAFQASWQSSVCSFHVDLGHLEVFSSFRISVPWDKCWAKMAKPVWWVGLGRMCDGDRDIGWYGVILVARYTYIL